MFKPSKLFLPFLFVMLLIVGCSQIDNQNAFLNSTEISSISSAMIIPEGATIESASLYVFVALVSGQEIGVHQATADWDESTVTYNSFGGNYAIASEDNFTADILDWKAIDVTSLVAGWADGSIANYGVLLNQFNLEFPRTFLGARESSMYTPYLEVCYTLGNETICEITEATGDAYITELLPDANFGHETWLVTGRYADGEPFKQSLIKFDLDVVQPELAAIGDYVWYDMNLNGIQDDGEQGVGSVIVQLMDCQGNVLDETTTTSNGYYLFDNLFPGDYNIYFVLPDGYEFTLQDQGADDAVDSDADVSTGLTVCTNLEAGEHDMTWDAGIYRPVQDGCSLTIGYWKTHAGFGPQDDDVTPLLPIWLGDEDGDKSLYVDNAAMAVDVLVMKTYGKNNNGITKLYAQLLGVKLNAVNGADVSVVAGYIADADAFLADHDYTDWKGLNDDDTNNVMSWQSIFDDYNNGLIGPGHCDYDIIVD